MIRYCAALAFAALPAFAEIPRVMTDIAPVHSLTAQVMGDLGTPDLLVPPGADPHDFALRPSDGGRLEQADLVIWVGEGLMPWLEEPLGTLASDATFLTLLETEGWEQLAVRDRRMDANHDDDDDHEDHSDHDDHEEDHTHDHGDIDPHAWLDPAVARVWVAAIAAQLGAQDPANAATYDTNAASTIAALTTLEDEIGARLQPFGLSAYVLPHDGYQYFEARFGLTAQASITGIDARTPGPAQVAALREQMADASVVCVFSDAEIGDRWAAVVTEGTDARTVRIDGVGRDLLAGPELYGDMLQRLANDFVQCLGGDT